LYGTVVYFTFYTFTFARLRHTFTVPHLRLVPVLDLHYTFTTLRLRCTRFTHRGYRTHWLRYGYVTHCGYVYTVYVHHGYRLPRFGLRCYVYAFCCCSTLRSLWFCGLRLRSRYGCTRLRVHVGWLHARTTFTAFLYGCVCYVWITLPRLRLVTHTVTVTPRSCVLVYGLRFTLLWFWITHGLPFTRTRFTVTRCGYTRLFGLRLPHVLPFTVCYLRLRFARRYTTFTVYVGWVTVLPFTLHTFTFTTRLLGYAVTLLTFRSHTLPRLLHTHTVPIYLRFGWLFTAVWVTYVTHTRSALHARCRYGWILPVVRLVTFTVLVVHVYVTYTLPRYGCTHCVWLRFVYAFPVTFVRYTFTRFGSTLLFYVTFGYLQLYVSHHRTFTVTCVVAHVLHRSFTLFYVHVWVLHTRLRCTLHTHDLFYVVRYTAFVWLRCGCYHVYCRLPAFGLPFTLWLRLRVTHLIAVTAVGLLLLRYAHVCGWLVWVVFTFTFCTRLVTRLLHTVTFTVLPHTFYAHTVALGYTHTRLHVYTGYHTTRGYGLHFTFGYRLRSFTAGLR